MGTMQHKRSGNSLSGTIGEVVISSCYDKLIIRSRPSKGRTPRSTAQQEQQAKFTLLISLLQPIRPLIRIGFQFYAQNMNAFNAAHSYHYHHALMGETPDFYIDPQRVLISRGKMSGSARVWCDSPLPGKIRISWDPGVYAGKILSNDLVMVALLNEDNRYSTFLLDAGSRADGSVTLAVPAAGKGSPFHCYVAFRNRKAILTNRISQHSLSTSQYAGSVIPG